MKLTVLVICLFLLGANCSTDTSVCTGLPSKAKDCNKLYDKDTNKAGYYCCYYHVKYKKSYLGVDEIKTCVSYTQEMYDAIEDGWDDSKKALEKTIKAIDSDNKLEKYEIKCQSSFIKIGFICVVAILLL